MATEEYEILLWILGDRVAQFNLMAATLVLSWSTLSLAFQITTRLWRYLDFQLDISFWNDTLMPDGPDDQPRINSGSISQGLFSYSHA